jgi:hypothetical protein
MFIISLITSCFKWKNKKICLFIALPFIFLLIAGSTLYLFRAEIVKLMDRYDLIPRNESFSELYFDEHLSLPRSLKEDRQLDFSFTIANHEKADRPYRYEVTYWQANQNEIIVQGEREIKSGESDRIQIAHKLPDAKEQYRIEVRLPESGQAIHFYLNKK